MSTAALRSTSTAALLDPEPQKIDFKLTITETSNGLSMSWNPDIVEVTQPTANFTITLCTATKAVLTDKIRWKRRKNHILQPPAISKLNLDTPQKLTFTDTNPGGDKTWGFAVWIWYNGKSQLSPDPTIVNKDV